MPSCERKTKLWRRDMAVREQKMQAETFWPDEDAHLGKEKEEVPWSTLNPQTPPPQTSSRYLMLYQY